MTLEPARAQPDYEMMDDTAHSRAQPRVAAPGPGPDAQPLHRVEATTRADILAQAVINDGSTYKTRLAAARAALLTRNGQMGNTYMNAQFSHALQLCLNESTKSLYLGMQFPLVVLHDAASQVVDYMQDHARECEANQEYP